MSFLESLAAKLAESTIGGWFTPVLAFLRTVPWWVYVIIAAVVLLLVVYWHGESKGETKGAAKVTAQVVKAHAKTVAESAADTTKAQAAVTGIGANVNHTNQLVTALVASKIEDMHHAIDTPPAAPGAAPAPVDTASVSASLDALIAGANRSADAADATGGT